MADSCTQFTGVIGSGLIGTSPYSARSWSGSSRHFFRECERQGHLGRAFGGDLPTPLAALLMVKNFHPKKSKWRQRYYMDPAYRRMLTHTLARQIRLADYQGGFLQIGGLFNLPSLLKGRTWCTSYHDGNLALRLRSPFGARGLSAKRVRQALQYETELYHKLDRIFTMSEYLRRSFIDDFGIKPATVVNIGAGVNLDQIPDPLTHKDYSAQKVLFVGIDFERKGGPVLLKAFQHARHHHPSAELHIVGPSNLRIPPELQGGVTCHGYLSKSDSAQAATFHALLAQCTLFALPSLYEPFGIAPAEGMLHGIPAIVTGDWALGETVPVPGCGWHVEAGSVESLTAALQEGLTSPDERQRRGVGARQRAHEQFLWSKVVQRLALQLPTVAQRTNL